MNSKKLQLASTLLLVLLCGTFCLPGMGFTEAPTHIDDFDDHTQKSYPSEDIWYVWIDHNATHLLFKVEANGSWDFTYSMLWIYISINDVTGSDDGSNIDFLADYCIRMNGPRLEFYDLTDGTDNTYTLGDNDIFDLADAGFIPSLGYFLLSNNNHTIEVGYKMQSSPYGNSTGYLNITIGQTIKVKIKSDTDTDYAPNWGSDPLSYFLTAEPDSILLLLLIILFPVIGVALGLFLYYRRRDVL